MQVPVLAWGLAIVIVIIVAWSSIWVTNKAYSRKWEDEDDENKGKV